MNDKYKKFFSIVFNFFLAMYPILVFYFLIIKKIPIRIFSLFTIALALFGFILGISKKTDKKFGSSFWNSLLLFVIGAVSLLINSTMIPKLFPVFINIILLNTFGITLFQPPVMIYRFAVLADKSIPKSLGQKKIAAYCYKVTVIWIVFFIINGSIAALTIFYGSDLIWAIYNNAVAPVLIGILFTGEFIVRKYAQRKIPKAVLLSGFNRKSRNLSDVMCYEGTWSDGIYKTWDDFLKETSVLRREIESSGSTRTVYGDGWFLYCEDSWNFLIAFTALLQCKKEIILSDNAGLDVIEKNKGDANFLTDHIFPDDSISEKTFLIQSILLKNAGKDIYKCPKVINDKTSIVLYTSDSTETPKATKLRLTELEDGIAFILSVWGEELLIRKFCSTVNQHHIYGILFSVLLPFTAGIPFRRQKVQVPEELIKLIDTEYTIITTPAFLKRVLEILSPNDLLLKLKRIFISDGVLDSGLAEKICNVCGFWPIEICINTETFGIAWRQSNKSVEWTAFDDVHL